MFIQNIVIDPMISHEPNGLRSGQIEVSMTLSGFHSEEDMNDWVNRLAQSFQEQYDVRRMQIGN